MSTNKVEMSLDEIIKANKRRDTASRPSAGKNKGAGGRSSGVAKRRSNIAARKKATGGVQKRGRIASNTPLRKNNVNSNRFKKNGTRGNLKAVGMNIQAKNRVSTTSNANTIATKRLVQNLVKKALAQRNVRVSAGRANATPKAIRRRGGVRIVKKTVVLNRISPKSRVIAQRRRVVPLAATTTVVKQQRAPIRYTTVPQAIESISPAPVRRNYVPFQQRRFVERRPMVVQRAARPGYQLVEVPIGGTVRQQINVMQRNAAYVPQQQQIVQQRQPRRFRQPQQQRRHQQQQQQRVMFVEHRVQPQQQRRRFQRGSRRNQQQQGASPFFEPPNYLQRISTQPMIVRRYQ